LVAKVSDSTVLSHLGQTLAGHLNRLSIIGVERETVAPSVQSGSDVSTIVNEH